MNFDCTFHHVYIGVIITDGIEFRISSPNTVSKMDLIIRLPVTLDTSQQQFTNLCFFVI